MTAAMRHPAKTQASRGESDVENWQSSRGDVWDKQHPKTTSSQFTSLAAHVRHGDEVWFVGGTRGCLF